MSRGAEAFKKQAEASKERQSSGNAYVMILKAGESVIGRFRGLFRLPAWLLTKETVKTVDTDWLASYAYFELGLAVYEKIDELRDAVLLRYQQEEPFVCQGHYIARNRGPEAHATCGDSFEPRVPCVFCYARKNGDKGISIADKIVYSFLPNRFYHKSEQKNRAGKSDFAYCSLPDERCRWCEAGHVPKQEGMKYFSLAQMHAGGLMACKDRVEKKCAACQGMGRVASKGWKCSNPECGEPFSNFRQDPEKPRTQVKCSECGIAAVPEEIIECSKGCEFPRRCQLFDVDVLVQRIGDDKKTTYSFTEQFPCEPLPNEKLLLRLPKYEVTLRTPDVDTQCRQIGMPTNPFTGQPVGVPPVRQAESYDEAEEQAEGQPFGEETAADDNPGAVPY